MYDILTRLILYVIFIPACLQPDYSPFCKKIGGPMFWTRCFNEWVEGLKMGQGFFFVEADSQQEAQAKLDEKVAAWNKVDLENNKDVVCCLYGDVEGPFATEQLVRAHHRS